MVLSLLTSNVDVSLKTAAFRIYSQNRRERSKFPASILSDLRPYWRIG
jgi:hypothetical protein